MRSRCEVSGLLPQPGGFEGLLLAVEQLRPRQLSVSERQQGGALKGHLRLMGLGTRPNVVYDEYTVLVYVDELRRRHHPGLPGAKPITEGVDESAYTVGHLPKCVIRLDVSTAHRNLTRDADRLKVGVDEREGGLKGLRVRERSDIIDG